MSAKSILIFLSVVLMIPVLAMIRSLTSQSVEEFKYASECMRWATSGTYSREFPKISTIEIKAFGDSIVFSDAPAIQAFRNRLHSQFVSANDARLSKIRNQRTRTGKIIFSDGRLKGNCVIQKCGNSRFVAIRLNSGGSLFYDFSDFFNE